MISLQDLKHSLISELELYATELKGKLQSVKKGISHLETQIRRLEDNILGQEYNQINYFSSLRRLHSDWPKWLQFMRQNVAKETQDRVQEMRHKLPIEDDYYGALNSIYVLLDVYLITPQDFAKGLLNGKQYNSSLDALDCYAVAQFALRNEYYKEALEWFYLSWNYQQNLKESQHKYFLLMGLDPVRFSKLYSRNLLKENKKVEAWKVLKEALLLPHHDIILFRKLREIERNFYVHSKPETSVTREYWTDHRECCRGEYKPPKGLSCYYEYGADPFLRIAPFKVELLNRSPYVAAYYDVLNDSEIEELKLMSSPQIRRSLLYNHTLDIDQADVDRTSNSVFMEETGITLLETISQRAADMTDLYVTAISSEDLQVINYGLGGQYTPHCDYFDENAENGDRLATVLFYLTDVQQGGATVFPFLRLSYFPKKGSALIFRNLDNAMSGDKDSTHSACPVLFGNKWVATKWIYHFDQMTRWPCLSIKK
ncbi:uncharacterized protein Dwil_GK11733 [Drosophila willistoni]|uniref:procollagen-proline 4-dioxygenase n=2 Tax=Drosophila willistoni TaxID=7260 RepID=B4NAK6_DROWI|nr:uncharacterized protein Dwil_GK11733 [Drosophila willistoni]